MSPKEVIVVLNNTRKTVHSVHAENVNAQNELKLIQTRYPITSYIICTLEEAEQNIRNSIIQQYQGYGVD